MQRLHKRTAPVRMLVNTVGVDPARVAVVRQVAGDALDDSGGVMAVRVRPRTNRIISRSCNRLRTGKVAYFERIPGFPGRAARFSLSSQQVDLGWTLSLSLAIFGAAEDTVQRYQPRMPLVVSAAEPS